MFCPKGKGFFSNLELKDVSGAMLTFRWGRGGQRIPRKISKMINDSKPKSRPSQHERYFLFLRHFVVNSAPFLWSASIAWWRSAVWQDGVLIWKSHPAICDLLRFEINLRILVGKSQALGPQTRVFAKEEEDSSEALMDFYGLPLSKRFLQQVGITRNHTSG